MKKIILALVFLAITVTFTSCSKDDSPSGDPIIGTWMNCKQYINNKEIAIQECDKKDTFTFSADGNFSSTDFEENSENGCAESKTKGTWKNDGNNNYTVTAGGESQTEKIVFESDTFYTTKKDGDNIFKIVFKKK